MLDTHAQVLASTWDSVCPASAMATPVTVTQRLEPAVTANTIHRVNIVKNAYLVLLVMLPEALQVTVRLSWYHPVDVTTEVVQGKSVMPGTTALARAMCKERIATAARKDILTWKHRTLKAALVASVLGSLSSAVAALITGARSGCSCKICGIHMPTISSCLIDTIPTLSLRPLWSTHQTMKSATHHSHVILLKKRPCFGHFQHNFWATSLHPMEECFATPSGSRQTVMEKPTVMLMFRLLETVSPYST